MLLKNARVINPSDKTDAILDIRIEGEFIKEIASNISPLNDEMVYDFKDKVVVPGLVDIHCHLREPGFEGKETIKTGIDSALAGGYTAICPMANTKPAVDNLMALKYTLDKARESQPIGFYPICALTESLAGDRIVNISQLKEIGAAAFSDDGKPVENMKLLKIALEYANSLDTLIISHSEDSNLSKDGVINESYVSSRLGLKGISASSESVAVARELEIVRELTATYHFAHISTKRSIELIRQAKKDGLNVSCETAPHYFSLTQDDMVDFDARYKVNPPLRTKEDMEAVIEGLKDGTIDAIATDHAPHTIEEKQLPIQNAPMGIVGFETALGLTLTNLVHKGHLKLSEAIEKLSCNPAKILKLNEQGLIELGAKANLTIIDLNSEWIVKAADFKSKCKISPFEGVKLKGKAIATVVNGKLNIG